MNKKKLRSFKPYLFDFLVIVLGVSVSFWFNQLAIKRSDNKERIKVLTSIEKEVNEIKKYLINKILMEITFIMVLESMRWHQLQMVWLCMVV